jgi:hypothetical protein
VTITPGPPSPNFHDNRDNLGARCALRNDSVSVKMPMP